MTLNKHITRAIGVVVAVGGIAGITALIIYGVNYAWSASENLPATVTVGG